MHNTWLVLILYLPLLCVSCGVCMREMHIDDNDDDDDDDFIGACGYIKKKKWNNHLKASICVYTRACVRLRYTWGIIANRNNRLPMQCTHTHTHTNRARYKRAGGIETENSFQYSLQYFNITYRLRVSAASRLCVVCVCCAMHKWRNLMTQFKI